MDARGSFGGPMRDWAGRAVSRIVLLGVLWWVLTGQAAPLSLLGVLGVALAALLSFHLAPSPVWTWTFVPWLRFFQFFLWQSFLGGLDVALRALRPGPAVEPLVIEYALQVRGDEARIFFLLVVSLLPGTAAVDLRGEVAFIHVLDRSLLRKELLKDLENRVYPLFVSCA